MAATQKIEDKYKKYELREHIYNIPDTYIGSVNSSTLELYLFNDESKKMEPREITYVPGLLKIFDEVIVNAIDHSVRLALEEEKGKENIKHLKTIKVNVNKETGQITVYNDGNGIDVVIHETLQVYIPELVTGTLLTSTNYNHQEEKIIGGKGGYGLKLTNIFSKSFTVETVDHYRQKVFVQNFRNNMLEKDKPSVRTTPKLPYTKITFIPDYERFGMQGMTDDIFDLFRRRTIDAAACTNKNVTVYFNDERLTVKDFEKYAELFIDKSAGDPLAYEACNDRWEVAVTASRNGTYEQISFVNGINTIRGGTHVNYVTNAIVKKLADMIESKKKKTIKAQSLKDNLFVFVKSTIVNPAFDSQSKETLTTPVAKYGSKCEVSDKFIEKLYKTNIVERALSLTEFQNQKKLTKTDGKKTSRLIIPKLDDANLAGTKDSEDCTLILTEGDSAKTMAIAGLSVIGRDRYGVFPLRGKVMNVKDAAAQKISDNAEITALKKILGLEQNKTYSDLSSLRYGKIMILTDQDHDGSHIKGLLFNVFQSLWPSLFKINGFLTSMLTPIIKASSTGSQQVLSFYNMSDYEKWAQSKQGSWKIKYYKGLGTSKDDEAKDYFKNMKKVTYIYDDKSDEHIDLAFNKKRADDRKEWLMHYNKEDVLDYSKTDVNYDEFVNRDLIHFSNRDLERSINHICDGLKESTRKILFACMKRKLYTNEIKVAQLAGNVSEVTAYHHGEQSLQQAIIGMAQIFVGTNNINLLVPNGQFGSRLVGGNDASSPRYIFTLLSTLTKLIFKEEDNNILNYLEEDGQMIEPEYYIPIIPMILVNGGVGIGTGFSTNVPQFNPADIINSCLAICKAISDAGGSSEAHQIIDDMEVAEFNPWYLGFTGAIEKGARGTYTSKGIYTWLNENTLEITELPIGMWTEDYKEFLEQMINNNANFLKSFENHYTSKNVRFILHFSGDIKAKLGDKFDQEFKLVSSKNLSINNMHLYSSEGAIRKYGNTCDILKAWSKVRISKYGERKAHQITVLEKDYNILSTKIRFIIDVIEGRIIIMNKKISEIAARLTELAYPKIQTQKEEDDDDSNNGYNYLLKMPISQLTYDRKIILEKEVTELAKKLEDLRNTPIEQIWKTELEQLLEAWHNHKDSIETDYVNDKNGIVTQNKPKRKAPVKRAPKVAA
jgi:DNA topoisomerase-2